MGILLNKHLQLEEMPLMRQWFLNHGIRKEYTKNDFFIGEGDTSKYMGYIELGSFRYIKWNYKSQEQVVGYSFENDFVVEYSSFMYQIASPCGAQAITDSVVWILNRDGYAHFLEDSNNTNFNYQDRSFGRICLFGCTSLVSGRFRR